MTDRWEDSQPFGQPIEDISDNLRELLIEAREMNRHLDSLAAGDAEQQQRRAEQILYPIGKQLDTIASLGRYVMWLLVAILLWLIFR